MTRSEENADRLEHLRVAKRRVFEHPAYTANQVIEGIRRSLDAVFIPNWTELVALLQLAATDEDLAFELAQNVRAPVVRDQFEALLTRRLHNHLASTMSLVEHVRRVMRGRSGPLASEFDRRRNEVAKHPEIFFMQNLRNYVLHHELPFLGHHWAITKVNTTEQTIESEVKLSCSGLLEWDGWTSQSSAFLSDSEEALGLRPIVLRHGELVRDLNFWLVSRLQDENESGLREVNELIVECNAILSGVDLETSRRITHERSASQSRTSE